MSRCRGRRRRRRVTVDSAAFCGRPAKLPAHGSRGRRMPRPCAPFLRLLAASCFSTAGSAFGTTWSGGFSAISFTGQAIGEHVEQPIYAVQSDTGGILTHFWYVRKALTGL